MCKKFSETNHEIKLQKSYSSWALLLCNSYLPQCRPSKTIISGDNKIYSGRPSQTVSGSVRPALWGKAIGGRHLRSPSRLMYMKTFAPQLWDFSRNNIVVNAVRRLSRPSEIRNEPTGTRTTGCKAIASDKFTSQRPDVPRFPSDFRQCSMYAYTCISQVLKYTSFGALDFHPCRNIAPSR